MTTIDALKKIVKIVWAMLAVAGFVVLMLYVFLGENSDMDTKMLHATLSVSAALLFFGNKRSHGPIVVLGVAASITTIVGQMMTLPDFWFGILVLCALAILFYYKVFSLLYDAIKSLITS